mgnify:CR=1 FL=1
MRFADIPGHDDVKQRLCDMADAGRIPHALLLEGTPGVGKFALARAFAQYIHCTNRQNGDSCGCCPSCVQHQTFNQVDTYYSYPILKSVASSGRCEDLFDTWKSFLAGDTEKDANRGAGMFMDFDRWVQMMGNPNGQPLIYSDESLRIISWFTTTSYSTRYKIMIMWLPERMQEECANKLLKLIEEPMDDSLMIFVSNTPQKILPTVYSRMQRIKVKRLDNSVVEDYLRTKLKAKPDTVAEISRLAEGSILDAIKRHEVSESNDRHLDMFIQLMRLAYQRKVGDLRRWAEKLAADGREGIIRFLSYCVNMIRENFILNLRMPELNALNRQEAAFASKFSPFINERNVESLLREFELARTDIASNGNAKMVLFHLAVTVILLIKR